MIVATENVHIGSWVRGLSTRTAVHGQSVIVEGRVMRDNDPQGNSLRELWVKYLTPVMVGGDVREGGWFFEGDLTAVNYNDPRNR